MSLASRSAEITPGYCLLPSACAHVGEGKGVAVCEFGNGPLVGMLVGQA